MAQLTIFEDSYQDVDWPAYSFIMYMPVELWSWLDDFRVNKDLNTLRKRTRANSYGTFVNHAINYYRAMYGNCDSSLFNPERLTYVWGKEQMDFCKPFTRADLVTKRVRANLSPTNSDWLEKTAQVYQKKRPLIAGNIGRPSILLAMICFVATQQKTTLGNGKESEHVQYGIF